MSYFVPRIVAEYYSRMVDNFVDNAVSPTNLANNLAMVNMETIQQLTDSNRTFWRTGVENSRINKRVIGTGITRRSNTLGERVAAQIPFTLMKI